MQRNSISFVDRLDRRKLTGDYTAKNTKRYEGVMNMRYSMQSNCVFETVFVILFFPEMKDGTN